MYMTPPPFCLALCSKSRADELLFSQELSEKVHFERENPPNEKRGRGTTTPTPLPLPPYRSPCVALSQRACPLRWAKSLFRCHRSPLFSHNLISTPTRTRRWKNKGQQVCMCFGCMHPLMASLLLGCVWLCRRGLSSHIDPR